MLQVGDPADLRAEHLQAWRDASKRVARCYEAWCAGTPEDRHHLHVAVLDALRREERAALQLERDASATGAPDSIEQSG